MRRYPDCIRTDGLCGACSASSRGRDCHNNNINKLLYQRSLSGMTQQQVADSAGMNIRQIQNLNLEKGTLATWPCVMPCHWQKPLTVRWMTLSKRPPKSTKICVVCGKTFPCFHPTKLLLVERNAPRFIVHAYIRACRTNGAKKVGPEKLRKGKRPISH